ncbi:unnamed protein product [Ectocarpus fasciculatus]
MHVAHCVERGLSSLVCSWGEYRSLWSDGMGGVPSQARKTWSLFLCRHSARLPRFFVLFPRYRVNSQMSRGEISTKFRSVSQAHPSSYINLYLGGVFTCVAPLRCVFRCLVLYRFDSFNLPAWWVLVGYNRITKYFSR